MLDVVLAHLLVGLLVGTASATLTSIVRVLPFVDRWMLAGRKPWVCDTCMTWWTVLAFSSALIAADQLGAGAEGLGDYAVRAAGISYVLGRYLLRFLSEPSIPPPPAEGAQP